MKRIIYAALAATLALIAASCDKQALTPGKKEVEGVYILNNGSMDMNNSKITVYDPQTKTAVADMFVAANGKVLGDTAQDILVDGDDIYISVNISRIIFVTDKNLKIKKEIRATLPDGTVLSPRYLAKGGNGRVYVTYYEGYLGEINPDGYKVSTTAVGASPEGCAWADGKVFVSNSGGANYPNYEKTVSVVDPVSFKETSRVEVNINPATMEACGDNVYVFSLGDYGATPAKVQRLDAKTLKVNDLEYSSPTAIALEGETLYVMCGGYDSSWNPLPGTVYKHDAKLNSSLGAFVTDGTTLPQAYSLSAAGGYVWVGCSDYKTNGDVFVFSPDGRLYDKFDSQGINPIAVAAR